MSRRSVDAGPRGEISPQERNALALIAMETDPDKLRRWIEFLTSEAHR